MITRVKATNYRCFKELDFIPNPDMNIIVGDNEAGKSTLLEVISLVISGRVRGRWATDDLNPYWFNQESVQAYFHEKNLGRFPDLPEICLEVYFSDDTDGAEKLRGLHNSEMQDCPGIRMVVSPNPEYGDELSMYLAEEDLPELIPTDLFSITWMDFSGGILTRRPKGLGLAILNDSTTYSSFGIDYKLRQLVKEFVTPEESAKIALDHRKVKNKITAETLSAVNQRIATDESSYGISIEMDQTAATNWESAVSPHMDKIPFPMLGQGKQVATKLALAMSRTSNTSQFVLIEEPENHLSHTQLQILISNLQRLSGKRQLFITTHSSFVLNRLGFDFLHLMHKSSLMQFTKEYISQDTVEYLKKLSGYDTLRLVLARKVVIVEGPSDEMVFNLAYKKIHSGKEPRDDGVDVIAMGTRGKRALEIGKALGRRVAVIRDNDGKEPTHWREHASDFLREDHLELFIGEVAFGTTLEPQVAKIGNNKDELKKLEILKDSKNIVNTMINNKTEWAWQLSQAELDLTWPNYILDAIEFINAE